MSGISRCMQSCVSCISSKPTVKAEAVLGFALTVIAALAVIGLYCPQSGLGVLGNSLTKAGSFSMLGGGLALLMLASVCKCCCDKRNRTYTRIRSDVSGEPYNFGSPQGGTSGTTVVTLYEQ